MNNWIFIMAFIAIMIVGLGIFAINKNKKQMEIRKEHPGYPKGHWVSQGMAMGIALGAGVGVALGNLAIGIGVGVAIGAALGSSLEKQHEHEVRPITEEEKQLNNQSQIVAAGVFVLGIIVFLLVFLMQN